MKNSRVRQSVHGGVLFLGIKSVYDDYKKQKGRLFCWPVTSYGPGYGVFTWHQIIFCRKNNKFSRFQSPASKVKISLVSMILFSRYVLVQSKFSRKLKMEIYQH